MRRCSIDRLNPYVMVAYYTLIMVFGVLIKHPLHLAIMLIAGITMAVLVAGVKVTARTMGYGLIMSALIILINPLVSKEGMTHIVEYGDFYVTLESVVYGAVSALMLLTVFMWFVSFNVVMTGDKYIYVLGRFLPSLSLLISLTLRLIPELTWEYNDIKKSARSMGMYTDKGIFNRARLSMYALKVVLRRSIANSSIRADSMEARGYGIAHRSSYLMAKWRIGDSIYLMATMLMGGLVIAGHVLGHSYASYYPIINIKINDTYMILSLICTMLFVSIPVVFEIEEAIVWKRYLTRISA